MPIKKHFFTHDFPAVFEDLPAKFTAREFYDAVMATMPPRGPDGENTTTSKFKKLVRKAVSNWLGRAAKLNQLKKAGRTGYVKKEAKPNEAAEAGPQTKPVPPAPAPTMAPGQTAPGGRTRGFLSQAEIGAAIEAMIQYTREERDSWKTKYFEAVRDAETKTEELRNLKTDMANLRRQLEKQNSEILRLGNEARGGKPSGVKLEDVARFTTKNKTFAPEQNH